LAVRALIQDEPPPEAGLGQLLSAGLIEQAAEAAPIRPMTAPRPSCSLVETRSVSAGVSARRAAEVGWALVRARARLKRRPFATILGDVAARKAARQGPAPDAAGVRLDVAAAFNRVRRLLPIKPVCLLDSLALLDCLARRDVFADLIFGVKVHPFGAHCWVQVDDIVLNEAMDHVQAHTPILIV
jgi:hypothetical protein